MSTRRKRTLKLRRERRPMIDKETMAVSRFALSLEVEWLREQKWSEGQIAGLWQRLEREYVLSAERVRKAKRRLR